MKVGSLFTGYGGLDMAVGGDLAWYAEVEPAACKVLAAHYPGVPNLGDVTTVDWSLVEPVDVITGGYPCQPFSTAGKRKGKDDDRHLWPYVRDAIRAIRPRWAVLENVRGHLTLGFTDVLADLADLGLSARWGVVRAADAGAPHNRARLFIVAYPGGRQFPRFAERWGLSKLAEHGADSADSQSSGRRARAGLAAQKTGHEVSGVGHRAFADASGQRHGCGQRPASLGRVDTAHEASARQRQWSRQEPGTGSVADAVNADSRAWHGRRSQIAHIRPELNEQTDTQPSRASGLSATDWGQYAPAITRWEHVLGRPAPAPTVRRNDRDRLSPAFVEWMMGLPEGHVTGHGLSPSAELKMLGNGVVPQQARLALDLLGAL